MAIPILPGFLTLSSRGPGHRPFTAVTRVRIPLGSGSLVNKDRTAGIEPRCDFLTIIRLLQLVNTIATAWGGSRVFSLTQQPAVAAYGVSCGLQVTEFDSFLRSFLCHFILLSIWFWPSVSSHLESHFWPFTEVMRKIGREVTRKSDGPTVLPRSRQRLKNFDRSSGLVCSKPETIPLSKCRTIRHDCHPAALY